MNFYDVINLYRFFVALRGKSILNYRVIFSSPSRKFDCLILQHNEEAVFCLPVGDLRFAFTVHSWQKTLAFLASRHVAL
jgi:hypothetical protein